MDMARAMNTDLYAAYAAGVLDPSLALLVETQAALRPGMGKRLKVADMVAGAVLEREAPASMSLGALDSVLAQIDELGVDQRRSRAAAKAASNALNELIRLPEPLRDLVFDAAGETGWRSAGPGIKRMDIDAGGRARAELLRMEPGTATPRHSHGGSEYTLVLQGGFTDERGHYGPGDLVIAGPEVRHRPVADPGEACIVLAVCDAPLEFEGVLGVLQKIFGK